MLQAGLEFSNEFIHAKGVTELTSYPILDFSAATGFKKFRCGGEFSLNSLHDSLLKWSLGVLYSGSSYQASGYLTDMGRLIKFMFSKKLSPDSMFGLQVTQPISTHNGWETAITCGYMWRNSKGSLAKAKLDTHGIFAAMWEGYLGVGTKMSLSGQFDLKELNKYPKLGICIKIGQ